MSPQPRDPLAAVLPRPQPRPVVKISLALMCGIVYGRYFSVSIPVVLALQLLLVAAWMMAARARQAMEMKSFHWGMALILFALIGAARMEWLLRFWQQNNNTIFNLAQSKPQTVTGTVAEVRLYENGEASILIDRVGFEKWNRKKLFPGMIEIRSRAQSGERFRPGDRLSTQGILVPVRGPSVPSEWNVQEYRFSQNIFGVVYVDSKDRLTWIPPGSIGGFPWIRRLAYIALDRLDQRLQRFLFWGERIDKKEKLEILGMISSITLGLTSNLPADLRTALSVSGLAHITSISGLHVTLVLVLFTYLVKYIGFRRKSSALISAVFACFYIIFVGAQIPAIRSVIMAYVILGQTLTERRVDALNSLALAALVLLLFYPNELFMPSFQMSFICVLLLILFQPLSYGLSRFFRSKLIRGVIQSLFASTIVTLGLTPFTIYYFHYWSWGAILGNLVGIPLSSLLLPISYLWIISLLIPYYLISHLLEFITVFLTRLLILVIRFFSENSIFWSDMPYPGILLTLIPFLALLLLNRPRLPLARWGTSPIYAYQVSLLLLIVAVGLHGAAANLQPLKVDFLGLGQGDCSVIRTPTDKVVLIDGGPPPHVLPGARYPQLVDYLMSEGVRRIDLMVLTHPESDHIGALADVARFFPVGVVIEGATHANTETYLSFVDVLQKNHIRRETVSTGVKIHLDQEGFFKVLNPDEESLTQESKLNRPSVVLLFEYQGLKILFTGDIDISTESKLLRSSENLKVDLLKVPHHGSASSTGTELLQATSPVFAVIELGSNPYGFPRPETLKRLYSVQAQVLRTDYDGTVRLQKQGGWYRLYTTRANRFYIHAPARE